jgi:hypothetical protein
MPIRIRRPGPTALDSLPTLSCKKAGWRAGQRQRRRLDPFGPSPINQDVIGDLNARAGLGALAVHL